MENPSDTDSTQILGSWDLVNSDGTIIVSVPTSPQSEGATSNLNPPKEVEKEIETRVSDKERFPTSNVAQGKDKAARRILPPWMDPSYEWGGGKWKEDGRKKKKKKQKEKEIPFKEIIEALLRNSGEKVEEEKTGTQSCVEILKSMGLKFP